ncbi:MAG: hypothetical protein M3246_04360 [Actinomycetota bacterium]|nr:hypothetical protein [Actinomycetota bacterium]
MTSRAGGFEIPNLDCAVFATAGDEPGCQGPEKHPPAPETGPALRRANAGLRRLG